ncbi:MAG: hypothetical protein HOK21_02915 [Rhodospirillaceae bacterium]|jgi:hypothetical protein|nr:hypothetical protein [Rhodospirillales bacterium]MBT4042523.1 hypothetical protein [Rhodospirillaceae bacterium]MBT5083806.1 hypothetical protein [Rhodospirillaceae bacterium]MBT5523013.1 hypothetical protein [Rhodospirillaceae bacterium]MBT5880270.1 hypothetical protein [Rhodospirillaceae bacterium]
MVSVQGYQGPAVHHQFQNHHKSQDSQQFQNSTAAGDGTAKAPATSVANTAAPATNDDEPSRRGKPAHEHDHVRRTEKAAYRELKDFLFGKLVSMLARFIDAGAQNTPAQGTPQETPQETPGTETGSGIEEAATAPTATTVPATTPPATATPATTATTTAATTAANQADDADEEPSQRGKSSQSPAHRARAELSAHDDFGHFKFGKLVSMLARFMDFSGLFDLKETASKETSVGSDSTAAAGAAHETDEAGETVDGTPQVAPIIAAATTNEDDSTGSETSSEGETPLDIVA